MKLFSLISASALLTVAFAADPASIPSANATPWQTISEKAQAAQKEALAIETMLKSKSPDMTAVAARAEALDKHAGEMAEAAKSLEQPGPDAMRIKASVDVLKVLTENKAKQMATADAGERSRFRATAKNIAMRAEQISKNAQKLGS